MDEILNKSLIALTNVIKNIDKSVLDDIIKRIDSLEENSYPIIPLSKYFEEVNNQFRFYYDFKNHEEDIYCEFNEENLIESSVLSMLYKSLDKNITYSLNKNEGNIEYLLDFINTSNRCEAMAA
jgi:hypothetical protein